MYVGYMTNSCAYKWGHASLCIPFNSMNTIYGVYPIVPRVMHNVSSDNT